MEALPFGRFAALVPEFEVKDLPLGRTHDDDDDDSLFMLEFTLRLHNINATLRGFYFKFFVICVKITFTSQRFQFITIHILLEIKELCLILLAFVST